MNIICVPSLIDNYIWIIHNQSKCLIIDPGEDYLIINLLERYHLKPIAILLTHHHKDHTQGSHKISRHFSIPIYGPKENTDQYIDFYVKENDVLNFMNNNFYIISLPGHTLGHIAYYSKKKLFCGDTLFSAGCGKIFEGTLKQMYNSLQKINNLPINTIIYPAHEYTLENLKFANNILPNDKTIFFFLKKIQKIRLKNIPSLPTCLYIEKKINLFLRCQDINLKKKFKIKTESEIDVFSILRNKKNLF